MKGTVKLTAMETDGLATKEDVANVRTELADRELRITERISGVNSTIADTRSEVYSAKNDILKWLIPIIFAHSIAMAGVVIGATHLFSR